MPRSVEARFKIKEHPTKSTFCQFVATIKGQEFSDSTINKWFYRLVDKEDYRGSSHQEILAWLYSI